MTDYQIIVERGEVDDENFAVSGPIPRVGDHIDAEMTAPAETPHRSLSLTVTRIVHDLRWSARGHVAVVWVYTKEAKR